jgi:hypothetical protein
VGAYSETILPNDDSKLSVEVHEKRGYLTSSESSSRNGNRIQDALKTRLRRHVGIVSGLPVNRPEPSNPESLVSTLFGGCFLENTQAGC